MGHLMPLIADRLQPGAPVADKILQWHGDPSPSGDSVPLRLAGALHALKLDGLALSDVYPPNEPDDNTLWAAVDKALHTHAARLLDWLDSPPQTNEVRRSAALLPALAVAHASYNLPVELLELGTSAGLNLRTDKFRLTLPGATLGHDSSPVELAPDWRGHAPPTDLPPILARRGVDLSPVDPLTPEGRLRLLAYIWPDQPDRMDRTEAAIRIAAETPAEITAGDAGVWTDDTLFAPAPDRLRVLFHTIAWQYFPEATKLRALKAMKNTASPLVRIAMEADGLQGAALTLTHYPSGEIEALGRADFHGRWIDWHGP